MLIAEPALIALLLIVVGGGALIGRSSHLRLRPLASSLLALTALILLAQSGAQLIGPALPGLVQLLRSAASTGLYAWCGLAAAFLAALNASGPYEGPDGRSADARAVLAAALLVAGKFALFEVGKLTHNAEMEEFFRQSGYSPQLHYVVAGCEITGSALLLLPFRLPRIGAALGLLVIMAGAVATHVRNGDPLTASHDALLQATLLIMLLALLVAGSRRAIRPR